MMARKPADVLAASPKPTGRPAIWAAIRAQKTFSIGSINRQTDVVKATIADYLTCLVAANIIDLVKVGAKFIAAEYRLADDRGGETPRIRKDGTEVVQGLGTEAMWRTMKIAGVFTALELALMASTEKAPVAATTAKSYLHFMVRAGFVRSVADGGDAMAGYRFVRSRDPGPKPPQIQRIKQVFDPNSNTVVWPRRDDTEGRSK